MLPLLQVLWFLLAPTLVGGHSHGHGHGHGHGHLLPPPAGQPAYCPSKCGNVTIPYPFGTPGCAWPGLDDFTITCNQSFSPPRPYLGNMQIINISLMSSEITVYTRAVSSICYKSHDTTVPSTEVDWAIYYTGSPMLISPTGNEFTSIGCSGLALLHGRSNKSYDLRTGCITTCTSLDDVAENGAECTGQGCCKAQQIAGNLSGVDFDWSSPCYTPINPVWPNSSCNYAFLSMKGWYKFNRQHLIGDSFGKLVAAEPTIPLLLIWAMRKNGSCQGVGPTAKAPACVSDNSHCVNVSNGPGYMCNCSEGYEGNPYVTGKEGCTNINECQRRSASVYGDPCGSGSTCHDTQGSHKCKCKFGFRADGKTSNHCKPIIPPTALEGVATFIAVLLACFMIKEHKQHKQSQFFDKNGGEILKVMDIEIFTEKQLEKITNRYSTPIGEGAFGKVFKGTLDSGKLVAVKRSVVKGEALRKEEFVNEITVQLRLKHNNLVCLVGCCLETDVPMLVYEYIPNGSLYSALHGDGVNNIEPPPPPLSLPVRLDIAIGSAEPLAYMHSQHGHSIVHGDVKSGNILLNGDFAPKVSDFGTSKLVSISRHANWSVVGDMNYIDPVYIKTGCFTEKSDVYSFGVVLLELITGKKAKYDTNKSLPLNFVKSYREGEARREEMYADWRILCADAQEQPPHYYMECLDRIGELAVRCLKEDVDERPTMAQVVQELKQVKSIIYSACDNRSQADRF